MRSAPRSVSSRLGVALAILAAGGSLAVAQQTPPRFAASTDTVVVDVLVTRDGKPVEGLTAADFVVRDAGTPQKLDMVAVEALPVNLLLALDPRPASGRRPRSPRRGHEGRRGRAPPLGRGCAHHLSTRSICARLGRRIGSN